MGLERAHDGIDSRIHAVEDALGKASGGAKVAAFGDLSRAISEHFRFEEESLFPNLLLVTGDQARPAVDLLQKEHVEMLHLLDATSNAIRGGGGDPKEAFEAFRQALATHQSREMSLVYPLSDMLLPPSLRRVIAEGLPLSSAAT